MLTEPQNSEQQQESTSNFRLYKNSSIEYMIFWYKYSTTRVDTFFFQNFQCIFWSIASFLAE